MSRPVDVIDSELRLIAAVRAVCRQRGGPVPDLSAADALLDERLNNDENRPRQSM